MSVHALKQVSTAPPPRSPEREELRRAIERHAAAAKRRAQIADAQERGETASADAFAAVKHAKTNLEEAKASEGRHLVDIALGKTDAGESPVQTATAALQNAEATLASAKRIAEALAAEGEAAEKEFAAASSRLNDAAGAAAKADPAMQRLLADYQTARATYVDLCRVMTSLSRLGCAPLDSWGGSVDDIMRPDPIIAQSWQAAVAALRTDADAELPQS